MNGSEVHIAAFLGALKPGGAERVILRVLDSFAAGGARTTVVLPGEAGPDEPTLVPQNSIGRVTLGSHRTVAAIPRLAQWLRKEQPDILLSTVDHAVVAAVMAQIMSRSTTRVVARASNSLSEDLEPSPKHWLIHRLRRFAYAHADLVVAPSRQLKDDLSEKFKIPAERIVHLPNPIVEPTFADRKDDDVDHPFFDEQVPVVVAAGRLHVQKDFPTLVRAFAEVIEHDDARLLILGDGPLRAELESLTAELGISHLVDLPGHVDDVVPFFARSDLFVLSSVREGSPAVLIEALASGLAVVATDCPTGPAEILQNGTVGALVPPRDSKALARAIGDALRVPRTPPPESWAPYVYGAALDAYHTEFARLLGAAPE